MRLRIAFIILSLAMAPLFSLSAYCEDGKATSQVVFLPFNAQKAGSYAVLKDGLRGMLSSRLALKEGVVLMENTLTVEEQERFLSSTSSEKDILLKKLGADFVAAGILLAEDKQLLLRVDFYSENGASPVSVTMYAENEQEIISEMDILTQRIAEKVFGHEPVSETDKVVITGTEGVEAFRTEHPDKKYKEEVVTGTTIVSEDDNFSMLKENLVRRSSALPQGVVSLAVGDGDGDGKNEVFVVSETDLRIFHYEGGILRSLAKFEFKPSLRVHRLNVADIDADGSVEIYISAMEGERFSSVILTWNPEAGIQKKVEKIRWAIRPLLLPKEGLVLVGQARGDSKDLFWEAGIHTLEIDAKLQRFTRVKKLSMPDDVNLFDFVMADIDGDGGIEKVAITKNMKLAVYDEGNSLVWVSEADYGGGLTYLGQRWLGREGNAPDNSFRGDNENFMDLHYLPTRLIAVDVNNDNRTDIITGSNILSTYSFMTNLRSFKGGKVSCLSWDDSKMVELWVTGNLDGYVPTFDIVGNYDKIQSHSANVSGSSSTKLKLYIGQIPNEGFTNFFTNPEGKANLVTYEFNIIDKSKIPSADPQ